MTSLGGDDLWPEKHRSLPENKRAHLDFGPWLPTKLQQASQTRGTVRLLEPGKGFYDKSLEQANLATEKFVRHCGEVDYVIDSEARKKIRVAFEAYFISVSRDINRLKKELCKACPRIVEINFNDRSSPMKEWPLPSSTPAR